MRRATTAVLGIQHLLVMFGATVLVPRLTGLDVAVTLFASGIGTLIFHAVTRFEVPVYLGSSFAFIPVITLIAGSDGGSLARACGGIVVAGLVYLVVSMLVVRFSVQWIKRAIPPHVTGPMIILIGLVLAPVAVQNADGQSAGPVVESLGRNGCLALAALTFGAGVAVKIYGPRLGLRLVASLPVLVALAVGYVTSLALGIVDTTAVDSAAWFGWPPFTAPEFEMSAIVVAVPVAVVTMMEHVGDILAIGHVIGKDVIERPGLHRTLLGDGLATTVAAFFGGPANTTYSENTGTLALTGNFNPAVMRVAAVLAVVLSFIPKVSAAIEAIPAPVVGGVLVLLFGMIASIGIKTMIDSRVDLSQPRVLIVTSTMLVLGLGKATVDVGPVKLQGLGLAAVAGIVLNAVLIAPLPRNSAGDRG